VEQDSYVPQLSRLASIDERVLRDELSRGPRPMAVRPMEGAAGGADPDARLDPLEREALTLLLLNPGLAAELPEGEPLPVRDEAGRTLGQAWRAAAVQGGRPDLEAFVAGLDPATADLARSLLATARARGIRPDTATDREALRVCLLRLRVRAAEERLSDLQSLIRDSADDTDSTDIRDLEQQFQVLTREREQLMRAMREPAVAAGERRS
jgi:hypothetical protein